ncbi:MAG: hypothetical protein ACM3ZR_03990 [Pseudomonadota bacterium]
MRLRLKSHGLAAAVMVVMFGGIALGSTLGYWETTASKIPAQFTAGEYAGQYDPAAIKGSYSFKDISNSFEIPVEILAEAFGLNKNEDAEAFQCKNLETRYEALKAEGYEIGTDSVRVFVALYKGLPVELTGTFIPKEAYEILEEAAKLTSEQEAYFKSHAVELSTTAAEGLPAAKAITDTAETTPKPEGITPAEALQQPVQPASPAANENNTTEKTVNSQQESVNDRQVRGKTTFKELLDWGLTAEEIESVIAGDIPDTSTAIKDYCEEKGMEFSGIKSELQAITDTKQ